MPESITRESYNATGLPGAQAGTRLAGGTVSGYPTTGTWLTGDLVADQTGKVWICTSGNSSGGSWLAAGYNAGMTTINAAVNQTGQTTVLSGTLYAASGTGLYTINYYAKVTTPATTSSILGPVNFISTDPDGNTITTVGELTNQNSVTTGVITDSVTVWALSGTNINYSVGYYSSGATAMQYNFHSTLSSATITNTVVNTVTSGNFLSTTSGGTVSGNTTFVNNVTVSGYFLPTTISGGTISGSNIVSGTVSNTTHSGGVFNSPVFNGAIETAVTNTSSTLTGTTTPAVLTASSGTVYIYTTNPTAAYQVQLSGVPTTVGQSISFAWGVINGSTAYLPSGFTINGYTVNGGTTLPAQATSYTNTYTVTAYYQGGTAWSSADTSTLDFYNVTLICTAANTYTMLLALTKY